MWVCSQLLEAQADYHRKALAVLEKALPEMRAHQGNVTCVLADAAFLLCPSAFLLRSDSCMRFLRIASAYQGTSSQHSFIVLAAFSNFFQTQINTLMEHLQFFWDLQLKGKLAPVGIFTFMDLKILASNIPFQISYLFHRAEVFPCDSESIHSRGHNLDFSEENFTSQSLMSYHQSLNNSIESHDHSHFFQTYPCLKYWCFTHCIQAIFPLPESFWFYFSVTYHWVFTSGH